MDNWISVKENLPDKYKLVLVFTTDYIFIAHLGYTKKWVCTDAPVNINNITHWMELPLRPEIDPACQQIKHPADKSDPDRPETGRISGNDPAQKQVAQTRETLEGRMT